MHIDLATETGYLTNGNFNTSSQYLLKNFYCDSCANIRLFTCTS